MVSVPIFEGDKGTGVISWCESLDRSQVQFQWTMAQNASVAVSRAGSKVSGWIRAQRLSRTTYDVWDTDAGLRAAIIKRFGPTVTALQSVHAVSDLKQRADESCVDFMDRIPLAVDMLHYNVLAADKTAQPYQDSFARLVKAHFGAGFRPEIGKVCLLYTSPSPRDLSTSRMPSSA